MLKIKQISYGSIEYEQMVKLRYEVLRKPLNLQYTDEYLQQEKDTFLVGCFYNQQLIGCCILKPVEHNVIQLKQMAVDSSFQNKGVGRKIIAFAESIAKDKGYYEIVLHARKAVYPFYKKQGYTISGEEFIEVNIPHLKMHKKLK